MIFLSYSRQQLYFAESLALHLQNLKHHVWFDLQQLSPGTEWQPALNQGLAACDQLVLVVSQAALDSPYVQAEWRAALAAGKPVVLVIFEATRLPDELQKLPTFDFRRAFRAPLAALHSHLSQPMDAPPATAPRPNRLGLRLTFPHPILLLLVMMGLTALGAIVFTGWLALSLSGNTLTVLLLALALWMGYTTLQFARRRAEYRAVRLVMACYATLSVTPPLLLIILLLLQAPVSLDAVPISLGLLTGLLVGWGAVALYLYLYVLNFEASLLRWFAAGKVAQDFRQRVNRRLAQQALDLGRTYRLHYNPADQPTATTVRRCFQQHPLLHESQHEADYHLMLVSNHTPVEQLAAWAAEYGEQMVLVIVAPIQIPASLQEVMKYQWVDFIGRDMQQLHQLAANLQNPDQARVGYALSTVPQRVERFRTPARVTVWLAYVRNASAAALALGLLALFRPFHGKTVEPVGAGLMVVIGLLGLALVHAVISRRVPLWVAIGGFVVLMLAAMFGNPLHDRPETYTVRRGDTLVSIAQAQCGTRYLWRSLAHENHLSERSILQVGSELDIECGPLTVVNEVVVPSLLMLVFMAITAFPLWRWLPRGLVLQHPQPTLRVTRGQWRTLAVSVGWVMGALVVVWPIFG